MASIQVEYEYGIDMDEAKRALESAIDNVTLPEGCTSTNHYGYQHEYDACCGVKCK